MAGISQLTDADRQASETRQAAGISPDAPLNPIQVLTYLSGNISIVVRPLATNTSGMCLRTGGESLIIANSGKSLGHQRFTLAHEYYHLRYDDIAGRACAVGQDTNPFERQANLYATCLLLPEEGIRQTLLRRLKKGAATLQMVDVIDIEQRFGVSHSATLLRLRALGYLTERDVERMRHGVIAEARVHGYSTQLYEPTNETQVFSPFASLARQALDRNLISFGKYEQMMLEAGLAELLYEGGGEAEGDDI